MANVNFYWNPVSGTTWNYKNLGVYPSQTSNWTQDLTGKVFFSASPCYPGDTGTLGNSVIYISGIPSTTWPLPTTGPGSTVTVAGYICNGRGNNFGQIQSLTQYIKVDLTSGNAAGNANPIVSQIGQPGDTTNPGPSFYGTMLNYTGVLTGGTTPSTIAQYPVKMYGFSTIAASVQAVANVFLFDNSTNMAIGNYPTSGVKYEYIFSQNAQHADGGTQVYTILTRSDTCWTWPQLTNWIMVGQQMAM